MQGFRHRLSVNSLHHHDILGLHDSSSNKPWDEIGDSPAQDGDEDELDSLAWSDDRDTTEEGECQEGGGGGGRRRRRHEELLLPALLPRESMDTIVEEVTQKSVEVYKRFAFQDPLLALQEEYRKLGIESIEEYFDMMECSAEAAPRAKERHYRRCVFRCPLSHDMRKVTSSCLPLPFLLQHAIMEDDSVNPNRNPPKDFLIERTLIFFGKYRVMQDGLVYFDSRVAAKKSAALKRLLEIHTHYTTQITILFESTMEASHFLRQNCAASPQTTATDAQMISNSAAASTTTNGEIPRQQQQQQQQHRRFPEWVHRLSKAGVSGATLRIQYCQHFEPNNEMNHEPLMEPTYWTGVPTLLCCVMEANNNKSNNKDSKIQVVGLPRPSKKEARDSAVQLLIDELGRNQFTVESTEVEDKVIESSTKDSNGTRRHDNDNKKRKRKRAKKGKEKKAMDQPPTTTKTDMDQPPPTPANNKKQNLRPTPAAGDGTDNMKKILASDKQEISFVFPLPNWARRPFATTSSSPSRNGTQQQQMVYLYELEIAASSSGDSLLAKRMPKRDLTTLGIIFPDDIEPPGGALQLDQDPFQTNFELPPTQTQHSSPGQQITVNLRHRSVLNLSDLKDNNNSWQLERAMQFTQLFASGGLNYNLKLPLRDVPPGRGNGMARTYLFVPLRYSLTNLTQIGPHTFESIDWNLIEDIATGKLTPYIEPTKQHRVITWINESWGCDVCPWSCLGFAFLLISHILSSCFDMNQVFNGQQYIPKDVLDFMADNQLLISACLPLLLWTLCPLGGNNPKVNIPDLKNRILISTHNPHSLYIFWRMSNLMPISPLSSVMTRIGKGAKYVLSRSHLEPKQISFAHFIFKKTGESIKYPRQGLLETSLLDLPCDCESFRKARRPEKVRYLVPEQTSCLAMPLDVLFAAALSRRFLTGLERRINMIWFCHSAKQLQAPCPALVDFSYVSTRLQQQCKLSLLQLLDNATTIHPVKYQRLEFLGDSVLGYVLALNAMSKNSSLSWDCEDLTRMCSYAGKNVSLLGGALRGGLNQLLQTQAPPWLSAYGYEREMEKQPDFSKGVWLKAARGIQRASVPDFRLSDVVEAVLGAIYLSRHNKPGASIMPGLLEILSLPFADDSKEGEAVQSSSDRLWLHCTGLCFTAGYSFQSSWRRTLSDISFDMGQNLKSRLTVMLEKLTVLMERTGCSCNFGTCVDSEVQRVMFFAALYDAELRDQGDSAIRLALLRDCLSCVGHHAISMIITEELVGRYPKATAADLHLLRRCIFAQQVLSYVVVKMGFASCLLDQGDQTADRYEAHINEADAIGKGFWDKRGGWWLEGGAQEYRRRCRSYEPSQQEFLQSGPRYQGILGGHLLRQNKRRGINVDTGNLIFSFKAFIGGLVLSHGVENMWGMIGCHFEELLLLSADELRQFDSPVVKACKPGTEEGNRKLLTYGILD